MRTRLAAALDEKRLSMRKASLDAGFSETYVHGILKLGRDPGIASLTRLCDTLELSAAFVIFGHDVTPEMDEILRIFQENPAKREALLQLIRE
ncbi:hypothetical protein KL867_17630 [Ruegeria litorea]|uniref:HTH cro/C1-type domain-containing protein n=2 Tax=Falsiruegeria litorea TaxID=1280831 RepID=A0ABS5WUS8_9RHOB|nr:hypothetical protein [Falsiruegeria litorea]